MRGYFYDEIACARKGRLVCCVNTPSWVDSEACSLKKVLRFAIVCERCVYKALSSMVCVDLQLLYGDVYGLKLVVLKLEYHQGTAFAFLRCR